MLSVERSAGAGTGGEGLCCGGERVTSRPHTRRLAIAPSTAAPAEAGGTRSVVDLELELDMGGALGFGVCC